MKESECGLWAKRDALSEEYHKREWCRVSHDDRHIFEMLCLEGQSVGLSWRTVMHKRAAYKKAFFDFAIDKCAALTDEYLYGLLKNPELIRNKNKIFAVRQNALAVQKVIGEYGSFDAFVWGYVNGKQTDGRYKTNADIPTETELSKKMSKDFKKLGMAFVGPVITYSFMQAIGMVNDHLLDCEYR